MQNAGEILTAFSAMDGARVLDPKAGPDGRLAVFLYLTDDGFVWVEPGYQDPFNSSPKVRYLDGPLELIDGVLTFPGGTIIEAKGGDTGCFFDWLAHCQAVDRLISQERLHVRDGLLGGEYSGHKLI